MLKIPVHICHTVFCNLSQKDPYDHLEFGNRVVEQIRREVDESIKEKRFLRKFRMSGLPLLNDKLERFLNLLVSAIHVYVQTSNIVYIFLLHLKFSTFNEIVEAEFSASTFCVFDFGTYRWQIMKMKRRKDPLWLILSKISWKLSFKMLWLMATSKFLKE